MVVRYMGDEGLKTLPSKSILASIVPRFRDQVLGVEAIPTNPNSFTLLELLIQLLTVEVMST